MRFLRWVGRVRRALYVTANDRKLERLRVLDYYLSRAAWIDPNKREQIEEFIAAHTDTRYW